MVTFRPKLPLKWQDTYTDNIFIREFKTGHLIGFLFSKSTVSKSSFSGKGELFTYWLCGKDDYDRPLPDWDAEDGPSHGLKIDDYLKVKSITF